MAYDPDQMEPRRLEAEKEIAAAVDSLEKTIARFREGFRFRRERREKLSEALKKVAALRRETVAGLKNIVIKTDRLKKAIEEDRSKLESVTRREAVVEGKYKELLSGRLPPAAKEPAPIFGPIDEDVEEDFSGPKQRFLERISRAFDELDAELAELRESKRRLRDGIDSGVKKIKTYENKRQILFKKLEIYKEESRERERELMLTVEQEEALLREYSRFARQIDGAARLSGKAESVMRKLRSDIYGSGGSAESWPFPENPET